MNGDGSIHRDHSTSPRPINLPAEYSASTPNRPLNGIVDLRALGQDWLKRTVHEGAAGGRDAEREARRRVHDRPPRDLTPAVVIVGHADSRATRLSPRLSTRPTPETPCTCTPVSQWIAFATGSPGPRRRVPQAVS